MSNKYSSETDIGQHLHDYIKLSNDDQMKAIMNPGHVDEAKWDKAKKISEKEYGHIKWPLVHWLYERMVKK